MHDNRMTADDPVQLAVEFVRQLQYDTEPAVVEYPLTHFQKMQISYQSWLFQRMGSEMSARGMICSFYFEYLPGHLHYVLLRAVLVIAEDP